MEIYIATALLILFFAFFELRCKLTEMQNKVLVFVLYMLIVIEIGLRWETGTDWNPYLNNFNEVDNIALIFLNSLGGFELGYGFLSFSIRKLFSNYSVFLVLHALFFYAAIFRTAKLFSPYIFVSVLFFYASNLGIVGSNRQLLALAICLLALPFVEKRKPIPFFICVFLASFFHTTAILFGIYYYFNRNFKWQTVFLTLAIAFIIGKTSLPLKLFSFGGIVSEAASSKVDFYSEGAKQAMQDGSLSIFGLFKRILFLVLFTYNFKYLTSKLSYYKILYNGYVFGLLLYFLFSSTLLILVNRGSLYFNVMESFLISSQLLILRYRVEKGYVLVIIFIIAILLLFQSISAYPDLFLPYKGLFYNVDFKREMY